MLAIVLSLWGHAWWLNRFYESDVLGPWSAGHLLVARNENGGLANYPLDRPEAWRGYAIVLLGVMHLPGLVATAAYLAKRHGPPWRWQLASGTAVAWYASLLLTTISGRFSQTSQLERALDYANDEIVVPVARAAVLGAVLAVAVLAGARTSTRAPRASRAIVVLALPLAVVVPFLAIAHEIVFG